MVELSNRFLATLVVIAMVISVFGTIASLSKLGELSPSITGSASIENKVNTEKIIEETESLTDNDANLTEIEKGLEPYS